MSRARCRAVWSTDAREWHRRACLAAACCGFCPAAFAKAEEHRQAREVLQTAFNALDSDASGSLDVAEMDSWFERAKVTPRLTPEEVAIAKVDIDLDRGGTVTFDELWHWWRMHDPPLKLHELETVDVAQVTWKRGAQGQRPALTTNPLAQAAASLIPGLDGGVDGSDDDVDAPIPTLSQAQCHQIELLPHWDPGSPGGPGSRFSRKCYGVECNPALCGEACQPFCEEYVCDRFGCLLWQAYFDPLRTIGENVSVEMGVYFSNLAFVWSMTSVLVLIATVAAACNGVVNRALLTSASYSCPDFNSTGTAGGSIASGGTHLIYDRVAQCCTNATLQRQCLADRVITRGVDVPWEWPVLGEDIATRSGSRGGVEASSVYGNVMMGWIRLSSKFVGIYLESFSIPRIEELVDEDVVQDVTAASILGVISVLFLLATLIAASRRLFARTAAAGEFLDRDMTTPSDFTLEVRHLPVSVTASQLAQLIEERGWIVDKVVLHRPIIRGKTTEMIASAVDAILALDVKSEEADSARRMSLSSAPTGGRSSMSRHQATLSRQLHKERAAAARRVGKAVEEAHTASTVYHGKDFKPHPHHPARADHAELPLLRGCAPCQVRTRFATAFVSFRYESERAECERSFSTWGHLQPVLCCQSKLCHCDENGNVDLPYSFGLGFGCALCQRSTRGGEKKDETKRRAVCGPHRDQGQHWVKTDARMRALPGWDSAWHEGWLLWWLCCGCCGARWATSVQPIGVIDWAAEEDAGIKPSAAAGSGTPGAAKKDDAKRKLRRKLTNVGNAMGTKVLNMSERHTHMSRSASARGTSTTSLETGKKMASVKDTLGFGEEHGVGLLCIRHTCGCAISVSRAPEPMDVIFQQLHTATTTRCWSTVFSLAVLTMFCALVSASSFFYIYWQLQTYLQPKAPIFNKWGDTILYTISYGNLALKLMATKVLIPLLASKCSKARTEAEVDAFLLIATFGIESMQTMFFCVATFVFAHEYAQPHLGGTDRRGISVTPRDKMAAFVIADALLTYYRTTLVNTAVVLAVMDSPFQLPVWLGRVATVLSKKAIDMMCDACKSIGGEEDAHSADGPIPSSVDSPTRRSPPKSPPPPGYPSPPAAVSVSGGSAASSAAAGESALRAVAAMGGRGGSGAGGFGGMVSAHLVAEGKKLKLASTNTIVGGEIWMRTRPLSDDNATVPEVISVTEAMVRWTRDELPQLEALITGEIVVEFQKRYRIQIEKRMGKNVERRRRRQLSEGVVDASDSLNSPRGLDYLLAHARKGVGAELPHYRKEVIACFEEEFIADATAWTWRDEAPSWRRQWKKERLIELGLDVPDDTVDASKDESASSSDSDHLHRQRPRLRSNSGKVESAEDVLAVASTHLYRHLYAPTAMASALMGDTWRKLYTRLEDEQTESENTEKRLARLRGKHAVKKKKPRAMCLTHQEEVNRGWEAPLVPYHIWTSKFANAILIICILGPWDPIIIGLAWILIGSMYVVYTVLCIGPRVLMPLSSPLTTSHMSIHSRALQ